MTHSKKKKRRKKEKETVPKRRRIDGSFYIFSFSAHALPPPSPSLCLPHWLTARLLIPFSSWWDQDVQLNPFDLILSSKTPQWPRLKQSGGKLELSQFSNSQWEIQRRRRSIFLMSKPYFKRREDPQRKWTVTDRHSTRPHLTRTQGKAAEWRQVKIIKHRWITAGHGWIITEEQNNNWLELMRQRKPAATNKKTSWRVSVNTR